MKNKIFYIILGIVMMFGFQDFVLAKEVVKECNYTYLNDVSKNGTTSTANYSKGGTINIKIYDDGSHSGNGKSAGFGKDDFGGSELLKNWGEDFNGIPDVKGTSCPDYIIVTSEGWWEKSDRWYGVSSSILMDSAKKLAELCTNDSVTVLKNDVFEAQVPTYTCKYPSYTITVDTDQKTLSSTSTLASLKQFYRISDELKETWFSVDRATDECLPTVACFDNVGWDSSVNYRIFNDSMEAASAGYKKCDVEQCKEGDCSINGTEYSCSTYNSYINEIESLYSQIENSSDTASLYKTVHDKETWLEALCKSVMNYYDYSESCVKACVNLEADLAKIKDNHGINGSESSNANCGLSARLAAWILKIINWMRYIVPVLLILLSVLDFIKAIAADSEDEIKKVTSKFVKRLIVAVIIFILPLALEFLLGVFGRDANNFCL